MPKEKIIRGTIISIFSLLLFFSSGSASFASRDISDFCRSNAGKDFVSFCQKGESARFSLNIFDQGGKKEPAKNNSETVSALKSEILGNSAQSSLSGDISIETDTEWSGDVILDNALVLVRPGAQLTIKEGTTVSLKNSVIGIYGKLKLAGSTENQIRIKMIEDGDNIGYSIITGVEWDDETETIIAGELEARFADISGGGFSYGEEYSPEFAALASDYAFFDIRDCNIHDNAVAIRASFATGETMKVNRTKFSANRLDVVSYDPEMLPPEFNATPPNLKHNWWGSPNGPAKNENGEYEKITGSADVKPWFVSEDFFDPVIVIPGIMGSATEYPGGIGKLKIDPILHTYDNLIASLAKNGYEKGKNLFEFPYEWRDSNIQTAQKLKEKIDEVKNQTGLPAVDLVAHSMGGLVSRYCVESEICGNDVNQLITLGTPHKGSPKSYLTWEAGETGTQLEDSIIETIFGIETKHSGYDNLREYIQARILSVRELLPDYNYLENIANGEIRIYPNNYPSNTFLDFLNDSGELNNLEKISFTNIVGENRRNNTISKFRVDEGHPTGDWIHGMPENYYDDSTDQGIEYGMGDETVPLSSAEGIPSDEKITLESSHGNLPTLAQCDVFRELTGEENCESVSAFDRITDILTFGVFSPVDIQIVAPDWKRVGKDFATGEIVNEISGAFYTGFETENEFLTIPNPEDGEYKILTQGTEEGEYKIEVAKITENADDPENAKESSVVIEGETRTDEIQEMEVKIADDQVIYNLDNTPPTINVFSPGKKNYTNNGFLTIDYEAEDSESEITSESWQIEKDGQILGWQEKNVDLSLEHLGNYSFKVSATDEAGNSAEKEVGFQITTDIDAVRNNINHYFDLGLIKRKIAKRYFAIKLKHLENLFNLLEKTKNSKLRPKPKQAAVAALKKIINTDIDRLIRQIERKSPYWIDSIAEELLIESLNFLKP